MTSIALSPDALNADADPVPLVIDVDGTLIKTDLLYESALQFVAKHPLQVHRLPLWLSNGKAHLKTALADRIEVNGHTIPLRHEVVELIAEAKAQGRPVFLASASERRWVQAIADAIGPLAGVFATDAATNLEGDRKAAALEAAFGAGGFDYVGNQDVDIPVWRKARRAIVVAETSAFESRVLRALPDAEVLARPRTQLRRYVKALRVHQWAKNVLVFLPLLASHRFTLEDVLAALLAFVCFSLAASSAYILNDLLDLPADREHRTKSRRPFAAGDVPVLHGVAMVPALAAAAFLTALLLPPRFAVILALYYASTIVYSLILKRRVLVDVITLAGLYTIRVFGGVAALSMAWSPWLMMFSLFLFLSLAAVKRCSELIDRQKAGKEPPPGRGYHFEDLRVMLPLGVAAGYGAVAVVALYLNSPEVRALYEHPNRLWLLCPIVLYWISRILILCNRGQMHEDPVVFATTDKVSLLTAAAGIAVVVFSA
ncbi:UbiA family prenyltransferase [Segnochrobactrum spirostomi]|uniref:UbiA family prenyltransferase n=1 Tax=Segnochrobactrum spirostomi TaxID=2608987 RepID=A0A6A7Y9D9_9HYPH|nr:UbiA family prenyltransferase [Segnochrobactrum spirostomi]MQT14262.1 UbiA family prenyltransferase [Segnochrobactrum spirostomi]